MPATIPGWEFKVQRGPECLLVKVIPPGALLDGNALAEELWSLMQRHLVHRLMLDLEAVELLNSSVIGELILLHRRIRERDGLLRLCGLSPFNKEVIRVHGLGSHFGVYQDFGEALLGVPRNPR